MDEPVPTYTETDTDGLPAWLEANADRLSLLQLPLTKWPTRTYLHHLPTTSPVPPSTPSSSPSTAKDPTTTTTTTSPPAPTQADLDEIYTLQTSLIRTLHSAIRSQNTALISHLITTGLVSPDVPTPDGATPLITSITAGHGHVTSHLIALGADPNTPGKYKGHPRTPLMVAAALGRLPLVKLLHKDYGADEAIIAPDGQLALRLAADAGHREVVDYLPSRRGGAFRRWRTHHAEAIRRIKKAGYNIYRFFRFFVWDVPRFFVWSVPKHVLVLPAVKGCRWCWANRKRFAGWCRHQVREMPGRVKRGAKAVWKVAKEVPGEVWSAARKVPGEVWDVMKKIPGVVERVAKAVWRFVCRIPGAMRTVAAWIWGCLKRAGVAVADVFLKVVSAVHTALMAVLGFFRGISLRDVWNGFCEVLRAVFVRLPQALWEGVKAAGKMTRKVLEGLFGCIGSVIWYFFVGLWWAAKYVPTQLWSIICGIGSSIAKGYHEILVWINPKH
ncbi:ankyrin repeat domain-containing protein 50 [Echria macrotheca]|uniref:Ankyrin repeat domain-containing protein 50 n=1 Tax=Echria macrotheca TaxID=438768 RepID=A0AAJ0BHU0_9PEZI|nr:ankyrin repeat domain-containing protein 50 [Echria macrotheca]